MTKNITPLRNLVLGRYPAFIQRVSRSPFTEVTVMAELAMKDARTTMAANLVHVSSLTKLECSPADRAEVKAALPVSEKEGCTKGSHP